MTAGSLSTQAGAEVRVEALIKDYGGFRAVDDVSLTAAPGEFLALLGPSGSGKTTVLMSIAGFETPTFGEVWIGGRQVTDLPPNRRGIGVVFQNYALFPHMSVHENIAYPLRRRGVDKAEVAERVAAAVDLVRLGGHAHKLPAALSGGQQQRVAIARATVFRPQLLLMDEPLGALDRRLREDMQFEIKELQRRLGVTIIYVTHDQEEAIMMADRIAVLKGGKLEQVGGAEDLYDTPANAFVADFIGQSNLLPGRLVAQHPGRATVRLADGQTIDIIRRPDGEPIAAGEAVQVGIRPERLSFAPDGAPGLRGTIRESIYLGGARLFLIEVGPGLLVKARIAVSGSLRPCRPGDAVTLAWDPDYVRLYPA